MSSTDTARFIRAVQSASDCPFLARIKRAEYKLTDFLAVSYAYYAQKVGKLGFVDL